MDGELLLTVVDDFSPTAVEEKDNSLTVFFSTPHARDRAREAILQEQPHALIVSRDVDDEDWARRSQQNLRPVTVGRIIVTPPWSVTQPLTSDPQPPTSNLQPLVVVINPSMGFGTGHHPSTRLCLSAMQRLDLTGAFVLDVGTGSGVLAIAARRLGARAALGIDADPDAIESAQENLQLNPGVTEVGFTAGDLTTGLECHEAPDIITANLTGALLVRTAGLLTGALKPGGHLILSGVMQSERAEVSGAFAARTEVLSITSEEEWVGFLLKKTPADPISKGGPKRSPGLRKDHDSKLKGAFRGLIEAMYHRNHSYVLALALAAVFAGLGMAVGAWQQAPGTPAPGPQNPAGRGGGAGQAGQGQQPQRDTSAQAQQQAAVPVGTGRISGRVLTTDTANPVRGARVSLSAAQVPGGRNMVTDASGFFDFTSLPEGRYTLSVSKTGFVTLAYGQRRPLQPGTPLQLTNGQRLQGIEMRLPRGSAIAGHIFDENGDPLPNTMVRVMRYQYQQGERRLTPAGAGQTDDKGQYRVWGLNPGDYFVSAVMPNLGNLLDQLGGRGGGSGGRGGSGGPGGQGGQGGPGPGGRGARGQGAADPNQAGGGGGRGGRGAGGLGAIAVAGQGGPAGLRGLIGTVISDPGLGDALVAAGLPNVATMFGSQLDGSSDAIAYAPTYYPGVSSPGEARAITVGLGAEALDIDFNLLLVQTSRISGRVTNPDGTAVANGNVNLSLEQASGRGGGGGGPAGGAFGESFGSRLQADGSFSIANIPPGRYTLRARSSPPGRGGGGGGGGGGRGAARGAAAAAGGIGTTAADAVLPQCASQPLTVGGDMADLLIILAPGATISGAVALQTAQTGAPPNLNQVRVTAQATDSELGTNLNAQVQQDGTFTIQGVPVGTHWIRAQAPRGLMLKAVTIGGRDVIDEPFEVRSGERVDNVSLVFTDKVSEINGTLTDGRGLPITDYTVLAYPEDTRLWRPQARQIMTSRPDQNGKFQLRGLPPGRYYLSTVDPAVAGEWFEPAFLEQHRDTAARLTLTEGEVKTQDFKMR